MRAAVLHSPGGIRLEDVAVPAVGRDEVLVRVAAVGVCGSDLPRMLVKGAQDRSTFFSKVIFRP